MIGTKDNFLEYKSMQVVQILQQCFLTISFRQLITTSRGRKINQYLLNKDNLQLLIIFNTHTFLFVLSLSSNA